jgi:hypothetical protein
MEQRNQELYFNVIEKVKQLKSIAIEHKASGSELQFISECLYVLTSTSINLSKIDFDQLNEIYRKYIKDTEKSNGVLRLQM